MIDFLKMVASRILSPFTKPDKPLPKGYRGRIVYDPNTCIGCGLCVRFCPSTTIRMKPNRKIRLDLTECCYCRTCEEICPVKCIKLVNEYAPTLKDKESGERIVE